MEANDAGWMSKLVIGSTQLKGKLTAKKRFELDKRIQASVALVTKTPTKLHRADEPEEFEGED
jgi:hypothetical protein